MIIEDEKPAAERLRNALLQCDKGIEVLPARSSVQSAVSWLRDNPVPDLIFMDVELSDGLSFRIFESVQPTCPIIFVTAYDEYWQQAFEYNSIDYLLKPIRTERLENALEKYMRLREHFSQQPDVSARDSETPARAGLAGFIRDWQGLGRTGGYRQRFLVKKGMEWIAIPAAEVAYCYSAYKMVFILRGSGQKFILDRSLQDLESELDPAVFFRVNRKYLVNINHIDRIRALAKGKLSLSLRPEVGEEVLVAQEKVAAFKVWMGG